MNEILENICKGFRASNDYGNIGAAIIEFDLPKDYLSSLNFQNDKQKRNVLRSLWIDAETLKFKLYMHHVLGPKKYYSINPGIIQNNQRLCEEPIYICYGKVRSTTGLIDSIYGLYVDPYGDAVKIYADFERDLPKVMEEFEKDKLIIHPTPYASSEKAYTIFNEELLNPKNQTINDCVIQAKSRIAELDYIRRPEYREKVLLERINELYKKVKGEFIREEILYNGNFIQILRETYRLPNGKTILKEKNIKNGGKNSVIVIAITPEKEYIITIQNRIKDKLIAEIPSGYIENNEEPIETAKRELKEETGYVSNDLFLVDEAYTSPGTDNSKTYIVVASNCIKIDEKSKDGTELVEYGLFSKKELDYLIDKNIMNGAMNKLAYYTLAYYTLVNKGEDKFVKILKKRNPLEYL